KRVTEENRRPFDLEEGPLFRAAWFRRAETDHVLLVTVHHIIFDGWSLWQFLGELNTCYAAFTAGRRPELPFPARGYRDFIIRQQATLNGPEANRLWRYWKNQLTAPLPELALPLDLPRPKQRTYTGATHAFRLESRLTRRLKTMARNRGTTLFSLLLSAYFILLHRYTGQEDILVGTPAAGRTDPEFKDVMGYFINPVILRAAPKGKMPVSAFLDRVSRVVREGIDHQSYPLPRLVQKLDADRSGGYSPLFQTAFLLHPSRKDRYETLFCNDETDGNRLDWGNLRLVPFAIPQQEGQFDLALEMIESGNTIHGHLKYDTALFRPHTMKRMGSNFTVLLDAMAEDDNRPIDQLPMITDAQEVRILDWNKTRAPYPLEKTVIDLFEARAAATPDAPALVSDSRRLTYGELNIRANRLARFLTDQGMCPGDFIGICLDRSFDMFIAVIAILKAGGAYVPLDPEYPRNRLRFILEDAALSMVLTRSDLSTRLDPRSAHQVRLVCLDDLDPEIAACSGTGFSNQSRPGGLAYVIYTSGTTGVPKGVMVGHKGLCNLSWYQKQELEISTESRVLQFASLSFDASCWEWAMALPHGAQLHIARRETLLPSFALIRLMETRQITHATLPPSALAVLPRARLPRLRCLITAGEPCTAGLVSKWSEGRRFINAYGPTESTVCATLSRCQDNGCAPDIGSPIANTKIFILDRGLGLVPPGVPGELCIAGDSLAKGYLNRPELTREKFVNIRVRGRKFRIYRTGDRARWRDNGTIEYLGRTDFQVKLRGVRIELNEVEAALAAYPAVSQAVAVLSGQGDTAALAAYVTVDTGTVPERRPESVTGDHTGGTYRNTSGLSRALAEWLRERLPHGMRPSSITILEDMPLTPNGKINRDALPAPRIKETGHRPEDPPKTRLQRQITDLWKEILNTDSLGITDNFFDIGGHSLLIPRIQDRLQAITGKSISAVALFQYPTIERLAAHIAGDHPPKTERAAPGPSKTGTADIAIIGMSGRFPGARNTREFWENLKAGVESLTFFTDAELLASGISPEILENPDYVRAAGFIEDAGKFDAGFFGFSPREAEILGPEQRIFLECAWEAMEDAGYDVERLDAEVGVFAGSGSPLYLMENLLSNPDLVETMGRYRLTTANDKDFLATRTSYKLNLKGPSINVQTACSTSLVAVHMACESLMNGRCDLALAGGVSITT
ncbi:MAG TPA: hypothetical protein DHV36_03445, partial [Desulfobacteraceae bacterium]|nr:hypothetical protein [Desulfobacteraceae bacterium]